MRGSPGPVRPCAMCRHGTFLLDPRPRHLCPAPACCTSHVCASNTHTHTPLPHRHAAGPHARAETRAHTKRPSPHGLHSFRASQQPASCAKHTEGECQIWLAVAALGRAVRCGCDDRCVCVRVAHDPCACPPRRLRAPARAASDRREYSPTRGGRRRRRCERAGRGGDRAARLPGQLSEALAAREAEEAGDDRHQARLRL
jgi:hypothetical protein